MTPLLAPTPFVPYGPGHLAVLAVFAAGAAALVLSGRSRRRRGGAARRLSRGLAVTLVAFQAPLQVYSMLPPRWDLGTSLPFQLCDLAWVVAAHALWTRRFWSSSLTYYWGLTLTSQALLTPQLEHGFPHLQFLMFMGAHCLVVWSAVYLTWGLGFRPTWRGYGLAVGTTVLWGLAMLAFNAWAGTNYLFVSAKPPGATLLDLLGEWPAYLFWEALVGTSFWALITWPWAGRRQDERGAPG